MMESDELQGEITKLLAGKVHVEVPSPTTDLMETGLLDSLALVELIVEIEQQFGIQIPLEEIEIDHFRSVVRIAEFVGHRKSHNSSIHK